MYSQQSQCLNHQWLKWCRSKSRELPGFCAVGAHERHHWKLRVSCFCLAKQPPASTSRLWGPSSAPDPPLVSSACNSGQTLASRMCPDGLVTEECGKTFAFISTTYLLAHLFIKEYLQKEKVYQAISGLLPMLDRTANIFGRDVNLNASGKKPSSTRWQRGGNSPYGQVFHSILRSIWYWPLAATIQGPVLWSSLPASVFLIFSDFLHTQDDKESFAKFSFLIHAQFEGLSGVPHFLDRWRQRRRLSWSARCLSSQAHGYPGGSNVVRGVVWFFS